MLFSSASVSFHFDFMALYKSYYYYYYKTQTEMLQWFGSLGETKLTKDWSTHTNFISFLLIQAARPIKQQTRAVT